MVPIKRFVIIDGMLNIDTDYIPPVLTVSSDKRYEDHIATIVSDIEAIVTHVNIGNGEAKRVLQNILFRLKNFNTLRSSRYLVNILVEAAHAVKFYIDESKPNELKQGVITEETPGSIEQFRLERLATLWNDERREPSMLNIVGYMKWLHEWLELQTQLLDLVVLVDTSIDYDQLKREIKEEVYQQLKEEIYEKMIAEMRDKLYSTLSEELTATVKTYIDEEILPRIKQEISDELRQQLYDHLYDALFKALYDELYRPDDDDDNVFLPMI